MTTYRRLTEEEALALNHKQLLDRLGEENVYWDRRSQRRMGEDDRRAMAVFSTILHRYANLSDMLDHTIAGARGLPGPDYLMSRVDGGPPRPPRRVQLSRRSGFRLPYGVRVVSRPGRFGNPFRGPHAVAVFARFLAERDTPAGKIVFSAIEYPGPGEIANLAYWDQACWCGLTDEPGEHCHADVLLRVAAAADPSLIFQHG
jgi:hypothetical protein